MKYLGIDYGTKRVGLAVSDDGARLAFPYKILDCNGNLMEKIVCICESEHVDAIVVGESVNYSGEANKVAEEIEKFIARVREETELPVYKEHEWLSSVGARTLPLNKEGSEAVSRGMDKRVDDSAAALILQRFLDRRNSE